MFVYLLIKNTCPSTYLCDITLLESTELDQKALFKKPGRKGTQKNVLHKGTSSNKVYSPDEGFLSPVWQLFAKAENLKAVGMYLEPFSHASTAATSATMDMLLFNTVLTEWELVPTRVHNRGLTLLAHSVDIA